MIEALKAIGAKLTNKFYSMPMPAKFEPLSTGISIEKNFLSAGRRVIIGCEWRTHILVDEVELLKITSQPGDPYPAQKILYHAINQFRDAFYGEVTDYVRRALIAVTDDPLNAKTILLELLDELATPKPEDIKIDKWSAK